LIAKFAAEPTVHGAAQISCGGEKQVKCHTSGATKFLVFIGQERELFNGPVDGFKR
jgi:hypothetical protein